MCRRTRRIGRKAGDSFQCLEIASGVEWHLGGPPADMVALLRHAGRNVAHGVPARVHEEEHWIGGPELHTFTHRRRIDDPVDAAPPRRPQRYISTTEKPFSGPSARKNSSGENW